MGGRKKPEPPKQVAAQPNPLVKAAADQVKRAKLRASHAKAKDLRRGECRDQLSLFEIPGVTE
ncbi:hypothetical protein ACFYTQ_31635 [Nocardia sp. NPDC004068]|uniref:hypothetical protein n=1 Tax=Nocardia sp. NPDC004068 TaxID=3364303 RepID=UPI003674AD7E